MVIWPGKAIASLKRPASLLEFIDMKCDDYDCFAICIPARL